MTEGSTKNCNHSGAWKRKTGPVWAVAIGLMMAWSGPGAVAEGPETGPGAGRGSEAKPRVRVISPNGGERFESTVASITVTWEVSLGTLSSDKRWFYVVIEKVPSVGERPKSGRMVAKPPVTNWMSGGLEVDLSRLESRRFSLVLTPEIKRISKNESIRKTLIPGAYRAIVLAVDHDEMTRLIRKRIFESDMAWIRDASVVDTSDRTFTVFEAPTPPAGRK